VCPEDRPGKGGDRGGRRGRPGTPPVAVQDIEDQLPEGRADLGFGQLPQFLPQCLAVVGGGLAEELRVILLEVPAQVPEGLHGIDITDFELEFALIGLDLPLDPHIIPRREGPGAFGQHVAPDPGLDNAALVPQNQGEERLAVFWSYRGSDWRTRKYCCTAPPSLRREIS